MAVLSLAIPQKPGLIWSLVNSSLAFLLIATLFILYKRWKARRLLRGFPTVSWKPRFFSYNYGDANKMRSSNITNILPRMQKLDGPYGCYGTLYGIFTAVVHVAHPIPARAILMDPPPKSASNKKSHVYQSSGASKSPAYNHFFNFSGQGVFTADGPEWRAKRASVLHCLLRNGQPHIESEAILAATGLISKLNGTQNVVPLLQRTTLSLIYRYLTHTSPPEEQIDDYLSAVTKIRMMLLAQSRSIWFLLPRWCYENFSQMYQREEETLQPIRTFAKTCLQCAKAESPLGLLQQKSASHGTDQDLLDEAITLLFAGQDTGAATLSWTLHLLSLYPHVQEKLHAELSQDDALPFTKLPYLDAVLKESMRLYPVAPFVVRRLVKDIVVTDKVTLRKDTLACIWIHSLHRNPEIWQDRPDEFVPERWLRPSITKTQLASYMPFCAGPRNCLGQPLAHVWLRILLGTIIKSVKFSDDRLKNDSSSGVKHPQDLHHEMQAGFTVLPLGGAEMTMTHRRGASETTGDAWVVVPTSTDKVN